LPLEKDKKEKLAEYIWTDVNKVISGSTDVQFSIKKIEKLQLFDCASEFNLALELDKLIERVLKKGAQK
jgi:hypothetical protein